MYISYKNGVLQDLYIFKMMFFVGLIFENGYFFWKVSVFFSFLFKMCANYCDKNIVVFFKKITSFPNGQNVFTQFTEGNIFIFHHCFKYVSSYMYIRFPFHMWTSFVACTTVEQHTTTNKHVEI